MLKLIGKIKCFFGFHDADVFMYLPENEVVCYRCGKLLKEIKS